MHSNFYIFSNSIHKPGKRSCFSVVAFLFLTHFYNAILMLQYLLGKKTSTKTPHKTTNYDTNYGKKIEIKMLQLFHQRRPFSTAAGFTPSPPSYKCNRKIQFSHCAILTITHYTIAVLCCMLYNISYYYQSSIRERYLLPLHGQ